MKVDIVHVVVGRPVLELDLEAADQLLEYLGELAPEDWGRPWDRFVHQLEQLRRELDEGNG